MGKRTAWTIGSAVGRLDHVSRCVVIFPQSAMTSLGRCCSTSAADGDAHRQIPSCHRGANKTRICPTRTSLPSSSHRHLLRGPLRVVPMATAQGDPSWPVAPRCPVVCLLDGLALGRVHAESEAFSASQTDIAIVTLAGPREQHQCLIGPPFPQQARLEGTRLSHRRSRTYR